jgi:hypothetical protein
VNTAVTMIVTQHDPGAYRCHDHCFTWLSSIITTVASSSRMEHFPLRTTLGAMSCRFINMFSMTALGVHDGDLMHFDSGVWCNFGWTYHPATQGEHAIRWFIHDPSSFISWAAKNHIPQQCYHRPSSGESLHSTPRSSSNMTMNTRSTTTNSF